MRILAGWDDPVEAELLQLYLTGGGDNEVFLTTAQDALLGAAVAEGWEVIVHPITFPSSVEGGLAVYTRLQELLPGVPIVLACRPTEIINLPRFVLRGLRFYLYRDGQ